MSRKGTRDSLVPLMAQRGGKGAHEVKRRKMYEQQSKEDIEAGKVLAARPEVTDDTEAE